MKRMYRPILLVSIFFHFFSVSLAQNNQEFGVYSWFDAHLQGESLDLKDIQVDDDLNIYLTGTFIPFDGFSNYDSIVFFDTVLTFQQESRQAFIAKLDSNRHVQWVRVMKTPLISAGHEIELGKDGQIYATGSFMNTLYFGANDSMESPMQHSFYIVSYSPNGLLRWYTKCTNWNHLSFIKSELKADKSGALYFSSRFLNSTYIPDIDTTLYATIIDPTMDNHGSFIGKINSNGKWEWVESITNCDQTFPITLDESDRLWITNVFDDSLDWRDTFCISMDFQIFSWHVSIRMAI